MDLINNYFSLSSYLLQETNRKKKIETKIKGNLFQNRSSTITYVARYNKYDPMKVKLNIEDDIFRYMNFQLHSRRKPSEVSYMDDSQVLCGWYEKLYYDQII